MTSVQRHLLRTRHLPVGFWESLVICACVIGIMKIRCPQRCLFKEYLFNNSIVSLLLFLSPVFSLKINRIELYNLKILANKNTSQVDTSILLKCILLFIEKNVKAFLNGIYLKKTFFYRRHSKCQLLIFFLFYFITQIFTYTPLGVVVDRQPECIVGRRQGAVEVRSQKLQNVGSRLHVLESVWCVGFPLPCRTGGKRKHILWRCYFSSLVPFLSFL